MKKFYVYAMGALILPFLASCGDDKEDSGYTGVNQIYLSAENPVVEETEATPLTVNVDLTKACEQNITLNFEILNDEKEILRLESNPVTIPAGSKSAIFQVVSNQKELLTEDTYFEIGISTFPLDNMKLNASLRVRVKPNPQIPELTEAQKILIEGYKSKYGIDLTDWLGAVTYHTKVESPASDYLPPFAEPFTKDFDGKTIITLSDQSTEELPVLKMVDDPMGLTEYLAWVLRKETIENDEFWYGEYASPAYAQIMELLNWNKANPGTFTMSLDGIKLKNISDGTATVDFLPVSVPDVRTIIPFEYVFSPWELQKKLIKEGNQIAIDLEEADGTANPAYYLQASDVAIDELEDGTFMPPVGKIDFKAKKLTFQFVFDHAYAGGYNRANVVYEKK